ncbi:MAG: multicopper oxidase domain-containing protein [Kineosporiaceae bacterium]|nr:multicopper oxidase domain-containing protein [Kineosporiaceae bacterium]
MAASALVGALLVGMAWVGTAQFRDATSSHAPTGGVPSGTQYWTSVQGGYHPTGRVRTYYLGAVESEWDYAPAGRNLITGKPFDEVAGVFLGRGRTRIGSTYVKCLYRAFTGPDFSRQVERPAAEAYLGFTGPVIRAEVGDTIKVVFRNTNCRIPVSVHPHGVFYLKASEGAPYADNTSGTDTLDDAVAVGATHTYTWLVPDRAGPGPHEGSSVMWMYHSHTDEVADTYAGLQGFMVITAKGMAREDGSPRDVDHEVFELFAVMDENQSAYLKTNLERLPSAPDGALAEDEEFAESNLMHSVNGFMYGNQPTVTLAKGAAVRWYLMSMGTEVDLHTPHWHGNTAVADGMRVDVVSLLPAEMVTADMVPDNVGTWLFHCHVNDHLTAGMVSLYRVEDRPPVS